MDLFLDILYWGSLALTAAEAVAGRMRSRKAKATITEIKAKATEAKRAVERGQRDAKEKIEEIESIADRYSAGRGGQGPTTR